MLFPLYAILQNLIFSKKSLNNKINLLNHNYFLNQNLCLHYLLPIINSYRNISHNLIKHFRNLKFLLTRIMNKKLFLDSFHWTKQHYFHNINCFNLIIQNTHKLINIKLMFRKILLGIYHILKARNLTKLIKLKRIVVKCKLF